MGSSLSTTASAPPPYDPASGTQRGIVLAGVGAVELSDGLPLPAPEHDSDAVVKVLVAGLCGSDLHPFSGREPCDVGTVMGHEAVGVVVHAPADAPPHLAVGARVITPFTTSCGLCYFCTSQLSARCAQGQLLGHRLGGAGLHGAQAEYVRVPLAAGTLVVLPPDLHPEEGLLLGDVFTTALFAAANAGVAGASPDGTGSPVGAIKSLLAAAHIDIHALGAAAAAEPSGAGAGEVGGGAGRQLRADSIGPEPPAATTAVGSAGVPPLRAALSRVPTISPSSLPKLAMPLKAAAEPASDAAAAHLASAATVRLLPPPVLVIVGCGPVGLLAIASVRTLLALRGWGWAVKGAAPSSAASEAAAAAGGGDGVGATLQPLLYAVDSVPHRLEAAAAAGAIPLNLEALGPEGVCAAVRAASAGRRDWTHSSAGGSGEGGDGDGRASDSGGAGAAPAAPALLPLGEGAFASVAWHGAGADAVIEAVGASAALALAFALLRPGGTLSSCGVHTEPALPFSPSDAYDKNVTYRSGRCPARSLLPLAAAVMRVYKARAAAHPASAPSLRRLIFTHRLPLSKGKLAYELFSQRKDGVVKVALYPDPSLIEDAASKEA